jgi:hypothetical protein
MIFYIAMTAMTTIPLSAATAITSQDVTSRMSADMSKGYVAGLVDMLSYEAVLESNRDRAQCIVDAFYRNDSVPGKVADAMLAFPDKEPAIVLIAVMKQICG